MRKIFLLLALVLVAVASLYPSKPKEPKTLLITGCAKSGTLYIASVLKANGMDFGHQRMKAEGISTWDLATNPKRGRWKKLRLKDYQFAHIFHQVRHPLKVISSVYRSENETSWKYILSQIPQIKPTDSHLVKCAKYWYYWNLKAEELAEWTYRLEDLDQLWEEFGTRIGKKIDRDKVAHVAKDLNTARPSTQFTWDDLQRELDPALYSNLRALADKYGYPM
jgi:hypothetical protein